MASPATSAAAKATPSEMSLSATYTSPSNAPFTLTHALAPPPSGTAAPTVPDKTAYLAALRSATAALQEQINKELTQRMEEDNSKTAAASSKKALAAEAREEEHYGEEVVEEE